MQALVTMLPVSLESVLDQELLMTSNTQQTRLTAWACVSSLTWYTRMQAITLTTASRISMAPTIASLMVVSEDTIQDGIQCYSTTQNTKSNAFCFQTQPGSLTNTTLMASVSMPLLRFFTSIMVLELGSLEIIMNILVCKQTLKVQYTYSQQTVLSVKSILMPLLLLKMYQVCLLYAERLKMVVQVLTIDSACSCLICGSSY